MFMLIACRNDNILDILGNKRISKMNSPFSFHFLKL